MLREWLVGAGAIEKEVGHLSEFKSLEKGGGALAIGNG